MKIAAYCIEADGHGIIATDFRMNGTVPELTGTPIPLREAVPKTQTRDPVVLIDAKGMVGGVMDGSAAKAKLSGSSIWYMTAIRTEDDILDSFLFDSEILIMPYHFASGTLMSEAYALSDSCMPAVFVSDGMAVTSKGTADLKTVLSELEGIGFRDIMIACHDGSLKHDDWNMLLNTNPRLVPFVNSMDDLPREPDSAVLIRLSS